MSQSKNGGAVSGEFSGVKTPAFRRSGNRESGQSETVNPATRKPLSHD